MSTLFEESKGKRIKHKIPKARKLRIRKIRNPPTTIWLGDKGPGAGLTLTYDPKDKLLPRMWVLSYKGLLLQATKEFPAETWMRLTKTHVEESRAHFEPVDPILQDLRRSWAREEMKRINFWDRVQRMGVKKHSHPKLNITIVGKNGELIEIGDD